MSVEVSKVLLSIIFIGLLFFLNYAIDTNVNTSVLKALALKERRQKGIELSGSPANLCVLIILYYAL